jgi:hypothetical protein
MRTFLGKWGLCLTVTVGTPVLICNGMGEALAGVHEAQQDSRSRPQVDTVLKQAHDLWKTGRRKEAIDKYSEIIRINSGSPYGHFGLGMQTASRTSATDQTFLAVAKASLSFYLNSGADRGSGSEAERRQLATSTLQSVVAKFDKGREDADGFEVHEGLKRVKQGELWGFADGAGKIVIKPRFQLVRNFSDGLAPAKERDRWGYIDKAGGWIIKPQFVDALNFNRGVAKVTPEGERSGFYRFIDKSGRFTRNPDYPGNRN